ncbi:MAG: ABC transporter substrate-binding protein, partial [Gracilibacteraceae bacterium]|nr:ABC transporter substrate-binding protein [Gracilibacteraceae bacterium]
MEKIRRITNCACVTVIALALAAALAGCASPAGTAGVTTTPNDEEAPIVTLDVGLLGTGIKPVGVIVAEANGYFEEEGVKVNFQKVSSMNDAYIAVSTG